jgi:hypothetical protein
VAAGSDHNNGWGHRDPGCDGAIFPPGEIAPIAADGAGQMFWLPMQARLVLDEMNRRMSED